MDRREPGESPDAPDRAAAGSPPASQPGAGYPPPAGDVPSAPGQPQSYYQPPPPESFYPPQYQQQTNEPWYPPQYQQRPWGAPPHAAESTMQPSIYATPRNLGRVQTPRRGFVGWLLGVLLAIWAYAKYAIAFGLKFGAVKTILTLLISFGAYAVYGGPAFAAALVLMILVHEMGHVVEIRRQGMQATAPLFIPFLGAAIFQRSHPTDAVHQALIGIAGPIAGTLGATVAFVLYVSTGMQFFLYAALIGFFLNLFNLIPFGMLDGGWILSAASKWGQVLGLLLLAAFVLLLHRFSFIVLLLLVFGIPQMIERFRNDSQPYYRSVSTRARWGMTAAWVGLVAYLGFMLDQAYNFAGLASQ